MTSRLQTALIPGGSSGLGRAFAIELARRNYRVAIAARSQMPLAETARIIEEAGGTVLPIQADVTSRSAVDLMVERTAAEFGPIDLLINNAGVFQALGEFSKLDPDAWWQVEINLRPCCARVPGMIKRNAAGSSTWPAWLGYSRWGRFLPTA
ncbi:MAG: SDR family NAD(P)-dependent oxidoreductase [Anaerolineales bacterium]|nr:SDR family NAD(P)-dependent oxidoreductase [Anaerolineales bacterium]